jgi:hypothetical protein
MFYQSSVYYTYLVTTQLIGSNTFIFHALLLWQRRCLMSLSFLPVLLTDDICYTPSSQSSSPQKVSVPNTDRRSKAPIGGQAALQSAPVGAGHGGGVFCLRMDALTYSLSTSMGGRPCTCATSGRPSWICRGIRSFSSPGLPSWGPGSCSGFCGIWWRLCKELCWVRGWRLTASLCVCVSLTASVVFLCLLPTITL